MTMSITGFPAFDRASSAASALRTRLAEQTAQSADGKRASNYAGLGSDARRAIDMRSELAHRAALARAAEQGSARAAHAQIVLKRLTTIASDMAARAGTMISTTSNDVGVTAQNARSALSEVASLLNERFDGEAVFGGSDTEGTPLPGDITESGLFRKIGAAIAGLGQGGGGDVRAALRDLGASDEADVTPFSAHATAAAQGSIPDPRRAVPVDDGSVLAVGLYANRNSATPASTSPDSTGSWSRDLLYALSAMAQLGTAQAKLGDDYATVVGGIAGALRAAVKGVTEEAGMLGTTEARLTAVKSRHDEVASQIQTQLATVEDVDMATAVTRLQATQTQLEASYKSLSALSGLSLAKFLG